MLFALLYLDSRAKVKFNLTMINFFLSSKKIKMTISGYLLVNLWLKLVRICTWLFLISPPSNRPKANNNLCVMSAHNHLINYLPHPAFIRYTDNHPECRELSGVWRRTDYRFLCLGQDDFIMSSLAFGNGALELRTFSAQDNSGGIRSPFPPPNVQ